MKDLSGGQKARVALAELCLNAPDVIILVSNVRAKDKELYCDVLIPACRRKSQHKDGYQY
jgi:energy-coupling factor transporter ATP-binding protein EcfA2